MAPQSRRFEWIAKFARPVLAVTLIFLALVVIAAILAIVHVSVDGSYRSEFVVGVTVAGALAIACAVVSALWAIVAYGFVPLFVANEEAVTTTAGRMGRVEALLESEVETLRRIADLSTLSDQAKSLIYRDREIDAFRETIQEDLIRQDFQTAQTLVDNIEKKFGYSDEAQRLRTEIESARKATQDENVDRAVKRVQTIIERGDFAQAMREAQRLTKQFSNNEKIAALPQRVDAARMGHKRSLLQEYGEAVRRNDIDRGVELLRELDRYLTPQEAAALAESARGVFRAKLHNLGVQFAISVADEQWKDAVATGEQIVREYPNSRMAQEVREKLDVLRLRAQG